MRRHEIPDLHRPGIGISIPRSMEEVKIVPTGFRFHPTEEELVCHYLRNKVAPSKSSSSRSDVELIREVDVYRFDPADLPAEAGLATGKNQCFFFSARGRRDGRSSRATDSGVWRIVGKDESVVSAKEGIVGMKRTLAFYRGKPPCFEKTEWMMNEYVLVSGGDHSATNKDSFAICRMFLNSHFGTQIPGSDRQPCDKYKVAEQDEETAISSIAEIDVQEEAVSESDELEKILMDMLDEEEELEGLDLQPSVASLHHEMAQNFAAVEINHGFGKIMTRQFQIHTVFHVLDSSCLLRSEVGFLCCLKNLACFFLLPTTCKLPLIYLFNASSCVICTRNELLVLEN